MRCDFCDMEAGKNMIHYKGKEICQQCALAITGFYRRGQGNKKEAYNGRNILLPQQLYDRISEYVIGQGDAKKTLCVAAYIHQLRIRGLVSENVGKSNILLLGPTGSGKTYMVNSLAKALGVPFVSISAASLTEAGYAGESVSGVIQRLYAAAGGEIEKAETGIVFIDEIDKLCVRGTNTKTVGVTGVQQELLTMLEGAEIDVDPQFMTIGIQTSGTQRMINTSKILFICGGAFPELENIVASRMDCGNRIGFGAHPEEKGERRDILRLVENEDLVQFGMIPELIGRLPVKCALSALSLEEMKKILCDCKGSVISQYQELFYACGVKLEVSEDAVWAMAKKAKSSKTGARALRSVVEETFHRLLFEIPGRSDIQKLIVTKEFVCGEDDVMVVKKMTAVSGV